MFSEKMGLLFCRRRRTLKKKRAAFGCWHYIKSRANIKWTLEKQWALDFDYIFYSFRDINDNYINWPIKQLINLQKFFKHGLIHAPHSEN